MIDWAWISFHWKNQPYIFLYDRQMSQKISDDISSNEYNNSFTNTGNNKF